MSTLISIFLYDVVEQNKKHSCLFVPLLVATSTLITNVHYTEDGQLINIKTIG